MKIFKNRVKLQNISIFVIGILATLAVVYWIIPNIDFNRDDSKNLKGADVYDLMGNEEAIQSYVKKFGPNQAIKQLKKIEDVNGGNCHDSGHYVGRFAYEVNGSEAFRLCDMECQSGCYHGAVEAFFRAEGTANLEKNLKTLCSGNENPFIEHQCLHGLGHGLMAWSDYELFDALEGCDLIPGGESSCYSGIFMENIVQSMAKFLGLEGHTTAFLNNDPLFPCNHPDLDEKYKPMCYFLQTDRMLELFNYDFEKVAVACTKVENSFNQRLCFESMGRSVGGHNRANPPGSINTCSNAPKGEARTGCLIGAVQDTFWAPSGQNIALNFCKILNDKSEKDACYNTIFGRAPQVLSSNEDMKTFCSKAESQYQNSCLSYINT
jgi:hypothetical protein